MKPSVLIVDDSLTVRMDLCEAFEAAGFAAALSDSIRAARSALAARTFQLVVLDVLLPDGDGIALLHELRRAPKLARVPVMLLSTESEVHDRIRGLKTGAEEYVSKPYDRAYVVARARQLVGKGEPEAGPVVPTLLLIDDSVTFREELRATLEGAGYAIVTAETGEDGLRKAIDVRPSAIIVDGRLPGEVDGPTVVRRIKQDVALRHTPCLLLTASEARADELAALDAGADAFLRKEASADFVLARLAAVLRTRTMPSGVDHGVPSLLGPKKILAVDDSLTYLHELAGELRKDGYDVILAHSGEEALALLEVQAVDCILLDLLMPGLSGQDTCRRVKSRPDWRDLPLIMLTALEERHAMIEGINAGADDYIPKSSDFEVLRARLRAQLRRKQFEDENRRIREELLRKELEAARARAAQELAETRAALVDELERKNRELEAFSYSVSHDLRAPLRHIDGFSQVLIEDHAQGLSAKAQDCLGRVRANAQRMGELIDDLLKLSRVGRAEIERCPTDLAAIAQLVAAELTNRERARCVDFVIQDGLVADADPRLMRVVFDNLMGNAWKFTARMSEARIEVGTVSGGRGRVYFVRDNGAGFDMTYADKLFRPFQRLHSEAEYPGTGIGLATVHRIVDRHGGRVWAESAVGQGATFFFTLARDSIGA